MQWHQRLERLEGEVFKTDVMASTNADFMATHMPFKNLSFIMHGQAQGERTKIDEEEIYSKFVRNPENRHRVIIVRGPNGAGKSHLIRWFNSRLTSDKGFYNSENEEVVFIRRLENNLRGAVDQLLNVGVVQDAEIEERMRKFINSVDSQDENHFKSTIYYSIIAEIENDNQNEAYTPAEKRDLAAFLNDSRVKDLLIQENGPISRIYTQIAKPKDVIFSGEAAFVREDFKLERPMHREIHRDGSSEARRFLNRLEGEEEKITLYLNYFTPSVIRRCSNISQGDAREIFAQLRRQLKNKGKCLTVFIEDFTAFTGIDAELITVLSTEHGGEYEDFCRVTAVIGITDAYYDQFKGNFKDRVTYQVEVGEEAYGSKEALSHMAALYINAILCPRETIQQWYDDGAHLEYLPVAEIEDNQLPWENIEIGNKKLTLYPFNSKAISELYKRLQNKTPREFLKHVILNQLGAYLKDQAMDERSRFPYTALQGPPIKLNQLSHASYIDNLDLTEHDKKRLRLLLCIWGEGHVISGEADGVTTIGGLPAKFFELMGFYSLEGVGAVNEDIGGKPPVQPEQPKPVSRQEQIYKERISDIEGWYHDKEKLRYSEDIRARVFDFLATTINWQYEGVAAYLAGKRYKSPSLLFVDGQTQEGKREGAAICIERKLEHRDVLVGLTMYHYYKGWNFKEAPYFQLQLISWLESIKPTYINAVKGETNEQEWPILKWAMAAEFLRLALMGFLQPGDDYNTLRQLLFNKSNLGDRKVPRNDGKWFQAQQLIKEHLESFRKNKDFLIQMENSYMGFVNQAGGAVQFFDIFDIEDIFNELDKKGWDLTNELPALIGPESLTLSLNLVYKFLPRVKEILDEEQSTIKKNLDQLETLMGREINADNLKVISNVMQDFLNTMNYRGLNYDSLLITQVNNINNSAEAISQQCTLLRQSMKNYVIGTLLRYYSADPLQKIQDSVSAIIDLKKLAEAKSSEFKTNLAGLGATYGIDEAMVDAALEEIKEIYQRIELLEVDH